MSAPIRIGSDAEGETFAFDGEVLEIRSTRAFAPGAPLVVEVLLPEGTLRIEGKSRGSKRRADGRFAVRIRTTSLRREAREALRALHGA